MGELHYLYKITNQINRKIYIGQTINAKKRWSGHKNQAKQTNPKQIISFAIKKYGSENFEFEVIAMCRTYEDANITEEKLIKQFDCLASCGKGYNLSLGGETAPKSEEFKQMMRDWYASLSEEEKERRNQIHRDSMINLIATKGHPAQGRIVTQEERELHRRIRLSNPIEYTEEIRQHMSEAHIGIKDSQETKQNKSESAKEAWNKRIDYSRQCQAPGCTISGKTKYKIIDGVRYCNKHGLRMLRYGRLDRIKPEHYCISFYLV